MSPSRRTLWAAFAAVALAFAASTVAVPAASSTRHLLYVAEPGIRNYVESGGVGVLVFDMDHGHRWMKRIPTFPALLARAPEAVKGVCASAKTGRLYVSTTTRLLCLDLVTEKRVWVKEYPGGCDRMSLTPDGRTLYVPSLEGPVWHVVDAVTGDLRSTIDTGSGSHNTICGLSGRYAYLAGLHAPLLSIAETDTQRVVRTVGPFGNVIRPFTVNGKETRCFVNVNDLLGFEEGDLTTGKVLARVEVRGYGRGPTKRHGCPSHGIGLTPDERELWLCDSFNSAIHVFDARKEPPVQIADIRLRDQPGWVTFSLDRRYAYPSTGDVVDVRSRKVVAGLTDEVGRAVQSEKLLEIDFEDGRPVRAGDQFGLGRKR